MNESGDKKSAVLEQKSDANEREEETSIIYCTCRHATLCKQCGIPMKTKDDTKRIIKSLLVGERPPLANVFGNGPLVISDIPKSSIARSNDDKGDNNNNSEVVLGIE